MEDQLVSFETAKLAKEKGFSADSNFYYTEYGTLEGLAYYENFSNTGGDSNTVFTTKGSAFCEAPTQPLLQKWLREKAEIFVELLWEDNQWYHRTYWKIKPEDFVVSVGYTTYEECLEVGLQISLELL